MVPDIDELIKKFFDGQCSAEEKIILNEWYHSFEDDPEPEEIQDPTTRALYEKAMLGRINRNIRQIENDGITHLYKRKKAIRYIAYTLSGVAAAILVFFGISLLETPVAKTTGTNIAVSAKLILENNTNKIQKYTLSDGSIVWLSPESKIEALKNFERDKRELYLNGMAFFEVTKNKARPFIIKTSTLTTKVWGTSFTVNAYKNAAVAKVSVLTGRVSVTLDAKPRTPAGNIKNEVMLLPHQSASYSDKKEGLQTSASVPDLKIWKKINLTFYNERMEDVIKVLNQKFEVHIAAGDNKINNYLFIADLSEQNLPSILEILKTSLDLNYDISNDEITLRSNH